MHKIIVLQWKELLLQDFDMWTIITNENHVTTTIDATTKVETITPETSWSKEDKEKNTSIYHAH